MKRDFYSSDIATFLSESHEILGALTANHEFALEQTQRDAWLEQIRILRGALVGFDGFIHFEYSIPRMGKRIDASLLIGGVVFVLEYKVGEKEFPAAAIDQVTDYALDLKKFHSESHHAYVAPILISIRAAYPSLAILAHDDKLLQTSVQMGSRFELQ